MQKINTVVAVYGTHLQAEEALHAFQAIGVPKDSILQYETALKADHFIVVAHGAPAAA